MASDLDIQDQVDVQVVCRWLEAADLHPRRDTHAYSAQGRGNLNRVYRTSDYILQ